MPESFNSVTDYTLDINRLQFAELLYSVLDALGNTSLTPEDNPADFEMKKLLLATITAMLLTGSAAYAATESEVTSISTGDRHAEIHEEIGEPDLTDKYGYKDIYNLSGGKRAILRYCDEVFDSGYIVVN